MIFVTCFSFLFCSQIPRTLCHLSLYAKSDSYLFLMNSQHSVDKVPLLHFFFWIKLDDNQIKKNVKGDTMVSWASMGLESRKACLYILTLLAGKPWIKQMFLSLVFFITKMIVHFQDLFWVFKITYSNVTHTEPGA